MAELKPLQIQDIDDLLNEAIKDSQQWEGNLGSKQKGKAEKAFEALRNGRVELGNPQADIVRLDLSNMDPSLDTAGFAFYALPVATLLFPGRGAQYRLIESQFTVKGENKQVLSIQNIFPDPVWKPVLDWGGALDLAIDTSLQWGAEIADIEVSLTDFEADLAGRVANSNQLRGYVRVIPFEHNLGRMEIEAQYTTHRAMWRIESRKAIRENKSTKFIILLKAPTNLQELRLESAVQAEVSFNWLIAQVQHIYDRLSEKLRNILEQRRGLPLQDFQTWNLRLPHN